MENLNKLPMDGVPDGLRMIDEKDIPEEATPTRTRFKSLDSNINTEEEKKETEEDKIEKHIVATLEQVGEDDNCMEETMVPRIRKEKKEYEKLKEEILDYPAISKNPLPERTTHRIAAMAYPTLFPKGAGDPTNPALKRSKDITLAQKIQHLLFYIEDENEGRKDTTKKSYICRFARHPRFLFWALDMIQRERAGEQGNYMLKTDPAEKLKSIEEIQSWFKDNLPQG